MESIEFEEFHIILIVGILLLGLGLVYEHFYTLGKITCLSAYVVDVVKRVKTEKVNETD